jgi:HAMP domain-containing protein
MRFILWTNAGLFVLLGLSVILASTLFARRVAHPLRGLNTAALDVANGHFARKLPVTSQNEIGRLAHTFNRMADALSERDAELRRRAQAMETLYRIGTDISSMLNLDRLLQTIVDSARSMLQTDAAALCLLREGGSNLEVAATAGPWEPVMGSRAAVCADDLRTDFDEICVRCQEARSKAGVAQLSVASSWATSRSARCASGVPAPASSTGQSKSSWAAWRPRRPSPSGTPVCTSGCGAWPRRRSASGLPARCMMAWPRRCPSSTSSWR